MTLHELNSDDALQSFYRGNKNVLVCFSATWCGPCRASKPDLEGMAAKYASDVTKDVKFGIIYEHNLGDAIHNYSVRAFPTYVLMVNGTEVERIEGVNLDGIRQMIERAGCKPDMTSGKSLGGTTLSAADARAQRLARFGMDTQATTTTTTTAAPPSAPPTAPIPEPPAEETKDVEMENVEEKKPPAATNITENLDKEAIKTLTESMGFSLLRAQKGLLFGNGGTVESAVEWLMLHQDDADIDDPIPEGCVEAGSKGSVGEAKSYKCNQCGKILSNMANLELHANKTGHSDFEESTESVKPLTPEEKAAKIAEIKALLKAKRTEREEKEKVDDVDREKQRRFMGKEMAKTKEQLEAEQRKRDAMKRKKEKEEFKRERERLRAELQKDKAERQANKGKLSSKLGVGGYKPDGVQYDADDNDNDEPSTDPAKPKPKASAGKISDYIGKVASYRAGGDGGKCLKILLAYIGNVVDKPDEPKFRSINMENKAFKSKVKPFVGAKQLLLAVGFNPNEEGTALVLSDDADRGLLAETKTKLQAAFHAY